MDPQEILASGLLELYCLGQTSEFETREIAKLAAINAEVRAEINQINDALGQIASTLAIPPPPSLKNKIIDSITREIEMPPLLLQNNDLNFWKNYLQKLGISKPDNQEDLNMSDLPGNKEVMTYVVWGNKGSLEDEPHTEQNEYLLVLAGSCTIKQNGITTAYKQGDLIFIPKNTPHLATVTSEETLVVIGQRIAA